MVLAKNHQEKRAVFDQNPIRELEKLADEAQNTRKRKASGLFSEEPFDLDEAKHSVKTWLVQVRESVPNCYDINKAAPRKCKCLAECDVETVSDFVVSFCIASEDTRDEIVYNILNKGIEAVKQIRGETVTRGKHCPPQTRVNSNFIQTGKSYRLSDGSSANGDVFVNINPSDGTSFCLFGFINLLYMRWHEYMAFVEGTKRDRRLARAYMKADTPLEHMRVRCRRHKAGPDVENFLQMLGEREGKEQEFSLQNEEGGAHNDYVSETRIVLPSNYSVFGIYRAFLYRQGYNVTTKNSKHKVRTDEQWLTKNQTPGETCSYDFFLQVWKSCCPHIMFPDGSLPPASHSGRAAAAEAAKRVDPNRITLPDRINVIYVDPRNGLSNRLQPTEMISPVITEYLQQQAKDHGTEQPADTNGSITVINLPDSDFSYEEMHKSFCESQGFTCGKKIKDFRVRTDQEWINSNKKLGIACSLEHFKMIWQKHCSNIIPGKATSGLKQISINNAKLTPVLLEFIEKIAEAEGDEQSLADADPEDKEPTIILPPSYTINGVYAKFCWSQGYILKKKREKFGRSTYGRISDFPVRTDEEWKASGRTPGHVCSIQFFTKCWEQNLPHILVQKAQYANALLATPDSFTYPERRIPVEELVASSDDPNVIIPQLVKRIQLLEEGRKRDKRQLKRLKREVKRLNLAATTMATANAAATAAAPGGNQAAAAEQPESIPQLMVPQLEILLPFHQEPQVGAGQPQTDDFADESMVFSI